MKTNLFTLILSLISLMGYSQTRLPIEEENPGKRTEFFAKRKLDPDVKNAERARWDAYLQGQSRLMEANRAPVPSWECLGPDNQGGRVISHAFDPNDVNTVWVGSASGGLWKTTDGANTWTAMTDNIPCLSVGAIAIKPDNTNIMLMGTGEGYVLSSWFQYGIGVLRSTDGGNTWNTTSLIVDDSLQFASLGFAWDPVNTNNVYLNTTYGVFVSNDAGVNWTHTLTGVGTSIQINKKNPSIIYASLQDYTGSTGGIYRSTNYGMTWSLLSTGLPISADIGFTQLAICDSFPSVIYAGISTPVADPNCGTIQGLYKTSNGGNTWDTVNRSGIDFYCYPAPFDDICQGWYGNTLNVGYNDSNRVFIGGVYLYRSLDGGASWTYSDWAPAEDPAWMHPDHHSFGFSPHSLSILYSFNDGGVFKSLNGGTTWVKKPAGIINTQFYYIASSPVDPNLMMGGTQDNGVFYNTSINSTQNWTSWVPGDGFSCIMDPLNANVWYTSEMFNGRLKTTNGGLTYDTIQNGIVDPTAFLVILAMDPENNQILYTGSDVNIYKTINGGANWTPLSNKPYITIIGIDRINPDTLYITNDPSISVSYIYRSFNGGTTWSYITGPGNKVTDLEPSPTTAGTLYVSRATYNPGKQVYKSLNSGSTWINITGDLPAIPVNCLVIDPNDVNHIYAGTDLGVYVTTNGGVNWTAYNDNFPLVYVADMHYYPSDSTIRVGTHGRGIWRTKSALAVNVNEIAEEGNSMQVYPNPANTDVTISYDLRSDKKIQISVYNTLGQELVELMNEKQTAGSYKISWNRKNGTGQKVKPGVYYIRMIGEGSARSVKVVIK